MEATPDGRIEVGMTVSDGAGNVGTVTALGVHKPGMILADVDWDGGSPGLVPVDRLEPEP